MATMHKGMRVAQQPIDWVACRKAYIERSPTPTYTELAKEFNCTVSSVSSKAREENWPVEKNAMNELALAKSEAGSIILKSIETEGPLLQQSRQQVGVFLSAVELAMQKIVADAETTKGSTMAAALNTVSFSLANLGKFMDSIGLVGTAKALGVQRKEAERNGQAWDKGTMQQINVTVNGMVAALKAEDQAKPVAQATESKPTATEPGVLSEEF
jgi:hypothetical protein